MLDMGFIDDIRTIISLLPEQRQSLLFSATFPDGIKRLTKTLMRDPATVQVTPRNSATTQVAHVVIRVENDDKREVLSRLIRGGRVSSALVFVRTKHGADRLSNQLSRDGIRVAAIHGNKAQSQRIAALDDFKIGRVSVLVATEVAARGIDIDALPHVINFDLPRSAEDYVHRIGRTGRAGADGIAISLVSEAELPQLREIEQLIGRPIPVESSSTPVAQGPRPRTENRRPERAFRPRASGPSRPRRDASIRSRPRRTAWVGLPGERQGTS
jgi:ATP-dependent RNA helicase RhlE